MEKASHTVTHCWMREGHWERAAEAAKRYVDRFGVEAPGAVEALYLRGEAWHAAAAYDKARTGFAECRRSAKAAPMKAKVAFMEGICCLQADRLGEAVQAFGEVEKRYAKQASLVERAHYWRGLAHSFASEPVKCLSVMRDYQERYPKGKYRVEAAFRIAFAQHAMGDGDAAIAGFRRFLKRYPDTGPVDEARLLLGDALCARGDLKEGLESYAAISPESTVFLRKGGFERPSCSSAANDGTTWRIISKRL